MQLATPKVVAMALRTLSSVCRMNFQVSFFFMVLGFRGLKFCFFWNANYANFLDADDADDAD